MGNGETGEPLAPSDAGEGAPSVVSGTAETARAAVKPGQSLADGSQTPLRRLLAPNWVAWAWGAHGLLGVIFGLLLLAALGSNFDTMRILMSAWVALTGAAALWRWRLDPRTSSLLLIVALTGLTAGAIGLLAAAPALETIRWVIGLFWMIAGGLELCAWLTAPRTVLQSPWIATLTLFVGVVIVTFPSPLTTYFTSLAGVWAIILGVANLARWLWVSLRSSRVYPATPFRERSWPRRALTTGVPALALLALLLGYGRFSTQSNSEATRQAALDAFYQIPPNLGPGAPGSIVRIEPLTTPGVHGRGWRILFRSQSAAGLLTISSGVVYAPTAPGKDHLVVAWAHGTVGLATRCAPSRQVADPALTPFVNAMLDQGWVVTAPDYVGAGGVGGSGAFELYLIEQEQGRDLLNSVRAAQNIAAAGAGSHFALYGHSQGGAVALAAAALAPIYAPELKLIAVGAVSAASDVGGILHEQWNHPLAGWILGPMAVYPWTRYYPDLETRTILTPAALNHVQEMATNNCITDIGPALLNPTMGDFFAKDPTSDPAWRKAFVANQAPPTPAGVPVFIGHGLADTLINPSFSAWLVTRSCAAGLAVDTDWMPGVGHGEAAIDAAPQYVHWLASIAGGQPPTSDCGQPLPIKPAQPLMP